MGRNCAVPECKSGNPSNKEKISWHRFPQDAGRKEKWEHTMRSLYKVRGRNFKPSSSAAVCSKHFTPSSYNISGRLRFDAIPTLFCEERHCVDQVPSTLTSVREGDTTSSHDLPNPTTTTEPVHDEGNENIPMDILKPNVAPSVSSPQPGCSFSGATEMNLLDNTPRTPSGANYDRDGIYQTPHSRQCKCYLVELSPSDLSSPHRARNFQGMANSQVAESRKKIRMYQQKLRRTNQKIEDLKSMLNHLKDKIFLSEDVINFIEVISECLNGSQKEMED